MASTTSKEPETPKVPGLQSGPRDVEEAAPSRQGKAPLLLPRPILPTSNRRTPSLFSPRHGDWTAQEDKLLLRVGAWGRDWSDIKEAYFPAKSSIAVRQRYEKLLQQEAEQESRLMRLMEERRQSKRISHERRLQGLEMPETAEAEERLPVPREADSWDTLKFQRLARDYMLVREEIWRGFAAYVGESWEVVEAKCMSSGLEHIRSAAHAAARREHRPSQTDMSSGKRSIISAMSTPSSHFDGDSGFFSMSSAISTTSHSVRSSSTRWETPLLVTHQPPSQSQRDDEDGYVSSEPEDVPSPLSSQNTESHVEALEAERTLSDPYDPSGQLGPKGPRNVTTRTTWEGTNYFEVEIGPHTVSRREHDDMINATKLFNVADVPRGRRDGILKGERMRHIVTEGPTHLKGVWIPYERALVYANLYRLTTVVHPLFARNIKIFLREPQLLAQPGSATHETAQIGVGALEQKHIWGGNDEQYYIVNKRGKRRLITTSKRSEDKGFGDRPIIPPDPDGLPSPSRLIDQSSSAAGPSIPGEEQRARSQKIDTGETKPDMLSATSESGCSNSSSSEEEEPLTLSKDGQKRLLLSRLMKYFHEILSSCPPQRGYMRTHTSGGRQGTSDSASFRSGFSSAGPSSQPLGGGRKRSAGDEPEEGDGQGGRAPKRPRGSDPLDESKEEAPKRLACPYFKMDPSRNHTARSCLGPGWATVHRIKEHLYRCHSRPISCPRCHETFEDDRAKDGHMAAEVRCEIVTRDGTIHEGFDSTQKELLRSRKKAQKQMTEIEKWYDVYMILFPGADPTNLPSPYYEYVSTDSTDEPSETSELSRYERFLRRELPTRVRQQLEIRIEEQLEPVEEHLRAQLVEIVRDVQLQLFDLYKASRTEQPPADGGDAGEQQELPEPEKREPQDNVVDPSSYGQGALVETLPQSFHVPALPPVPIWNPTIDEQLEAFRPEPPYTGDYFDDFNGLLFDFHPSLLAGSNSPGDSGYMSVPAFADYMQPKVLSHPQPGAGPEYPTSDGRRN